MAKRTRDKADYALHESNWVVLDQNTHYFHFTAAEASQRSGWRCISKKTVERKKVVSTTEGERKNRAVQEAVERKRITKVITGRTKVLGTREKRQNMRL